MNFGGSMGKLNMLKGLWAVEYKLCISADSQIYQLPFAVRVFTSIQEAAPKSGILVSWT